MAGNMARISWDKLEIAIPSFVILATMPLTYSIADGIALGVIFYPITMITAKRGKEGSTFDVCIILRIFNLLMDFANRRIINLNEY